jgi:hypothetical protein
MLTTNSNVALSVAKTQEDNSPMIDLGMCDVELEPVCSGENCSAARPYGSIQFSTIVLTGSEAYCILMNAEKDALARRWEVTLPSSSYIQLAGYVSAIRMEAVVNTDHLVLNVNVDLTAGPSHEFTCS